MSDPAVKDPRRPCPTSGRRPCRWRRAGRRAPWETRLPLALALGLWLAGCGYQFQVEGPGPTIGGGPPVTRGDGPKLAVAFFRNNSFEPNLEVKYTTYTRQEFAATSGARVVELSEPADVVLKGEILSVIVPTLTFSIDRTLESRVTVFVRATAEDPRTGKVLWTQTVNASSEFFVTDDLQFNRVLQTRALEQAGRLIAGDLAVRFLDHLESGALEKARAAKTGITVPDPYTPAPAESDSPARQQGAPTP